MVVVNNRICNFISVNTGLSVCRPCTFQRYSDIPLLQVVHPHHTVSRFGNEVQFSIVVVKFPESF